MKLKIGDTVKVTAGREKGKTGEIAKILPERNAVVIKDVNLYTKHVRPVADRSGERVKRERALPVANVAIINDKKEVDRVGYSIAKDGSKTRIFKKTGKVIPTKKADKK